MKIIKLTTSLKIGTTNKWTEVVSNNSNTDLSRSKLGQPYIQNITYSLYFCTFNSSEYMDRLLSSLS